MGTITDRVSGTTVLSGSIRETRTHRVTGLIGVWGELQGWGSGCGLYPDEELYPNEALYPTEPCPPGPDPVLNYLRVREKPSLNQSVMVTTSSGKTYRWGEDDQIPERSFHDLSYGGGVPGGFDQMSATLPRKPGVDYADLELFSNIEVIDASGEVTGEYRMDSAPVTAGNDFVISPNAVGWQAALEDRKDVTFLGVDIDMSHWTGLSANAQVLAGTTYATGGPEIRPAPLGGSINPPGVWTGVSGFTAGQLPWIIAEYDAGSFLNIGEIEYQWKKHDNQPNGPDDYFWELALSADEDPAGWGDETGDLQGGAASGTLSSTTDERFAFAYWQRLSALGSDFEKDIGVWWVMLAVIGDHGLTTHKVGLPSGVSAPGLYASDVIEYIIDTFVTDLNIGTIDATTFVIPQLEMRTPTTPAEIVKQTNRFHLYDWFVGPGKRFHYRQRGTYGRNWISRVGPAKLESTGQTAARCITDVLVSFQDVDGTPKYVGPTGSGADTESASLHDSDTQNPANAAGISTWAVLDMGQVSTPAAATQVGMRFLEEINALDHSGRATLEGHVMNDKGVLFPFSSVQAGDTITFLDAADTSARRIVKATKAQNSVSIDLDAPPEGVNALLERLNVQWTNLSGISAPPLPPAKNTPGWVDPSQKNVVVPG